MDAQQITYDICRCYLNDQKGTMQEDLWKRLHGLYRARDYKSLASCTDYLVHDVTWTKDDYRATYQVEALFKKNKAFTDPVVARLASLVSFDEGEELCQSTNDRLDEFYSDRKYPEHRRALSKMEKYIDHVLGDFADFLEELPELVYVTAGATATRSRRRSIPFLKVSKKVVCTPGAVPYLTALSEFFGYGSLAPRLISANRVEFVPKSWKTDRTIACEAEGNMILQLAFDMYAKRRLRRRGIDLSDQTRNQELARVGSLSHGENYATIDLSMASDTLAYNTVAVLLPEKWFQYLRSIRSQYGQIKSGPKEAYAKFSSMGNGATFSLETLVFAAACHAVGSRSYLVYGDDIIIEQDLADDLLALLAFLGFVPNRSKSFTRGPFRESCGTHWFEGSLITPRYLREIDRRKAVQCHLVNSMMEIAKPWGCLWQYLVEMVHKNSLPLVPYNEDSMSGVWIHPSLAYSEKLIRTHGRWGSWVPKFKAYKPKTNARSNHDSRSLFLWHLGVRRRAVVSIPVRLGGFTTRLDFWEAYESSRYTLSSHKYVRKWVHWIPVMGAPDHLYWWSESLIRESQ